MGKLVQTFTAKGSDIEFSHTEKPVELWCVRIPHTRLGEANYRRSTAERATSASEIEIKWFGQVFSEPA